MNVKWRKTSTGYWVRLSRHDLAVKVWQRLYKDVFVTDDGLEHDKLNDAKLHAIKLMREDLQRVMAELDELEKRERGEA